MLSTEQIAHFETFGFLVLRQLFTANEMSVLAQEGREIFANERGDTPADEAETQDIVQFFERKPYLSGLVDDDRVYEIGVDLLGPDFILHATSGARRIGDTSWHADSPVDSARRTANISFYTDELTRNNGCLRVVPGSHVAGEPDLLAPLRNTNKDPEFRPFGVRPSAVPCYYYESVPGDVIVFSAKLLHASFDSKAARHMHLISFMGNPTTDAEIAAIRELYDVSRWGLHPAESYVNSESPRVRRMVSRLVELGFETSKW